MTRRRKEEGHGEKAPLWILSFGDMITNFLAFFILMQSFSSSQRADLLQTGDGNATAMVADFGGAPRWLVGKRPEPEFGARPQKHPVEEDPNNLAPERIIDAEDEQIRKLYDDIRRAMRTQASDLKRGTTRIVPTPITFAPGEAAIGPEVCDFLTTLGADLLQDPAAPGLDLYVIGMAPDPLPRVPPADLRRAQYILSAQRAQAVHEALSATLPPELRAGGSQVLSWGIGSGREGVRGLTGPRQPQIVIAVVESQHKESE
jgi:hypothetical protein